MFHIRRKNLQKAFRYGAKYTLIEYMEELHDSQSVRIHNGKDRLVSSRAEYVKAALKGVLMGSKFDWRNAKVLRVENIDGERNVWLEE